MRRRLRSEPRPVAAGYSPGPALPRPSLGLAAVVPLLVPRSGSAVRPLTCRGDSSSRAIAIDLRPVHAVRAAPQRAGAVGRQRPGWNGVLPALERSLYTWTASLLFIASARCWQPRPGLLYTLDGVVRLLATAIQAGRRRADRPQVGGCSTCSTWPGRPAAAPGGQRRHREHCRWKPRALRFRPSPALFRLGPDGLRRAGHDGHAGPFRHRQHALPGRGDSLGGAQPARAFGREYATIGAKVRWRMLPGIY